MGLHDRRYWRGDDGRDGSGGGTTVSLGLPRPGRAVGGLLIANFIVFLLQMFMDRPSAEFRAGTMSAWFGVTVGSFYEVWRYLTFQFLHADPWHIVMNMFGLYMLGCPLERQWGPRRFLTFYLVCGAVAGLAYVVIGAIGGIPSWVPIIGASGGVFATLLACAVLFPDFKIVLVILLVPIRVAAVVIFGGMLLLMLWVFARGGIEQGLSDAAHLGGAGAAACWIWVLPKVSSIGSDWMANRRRGAWDRKMRKRQADEDRIDAILKKIREHGLDSLSSSEKRELQEATRRQQEEDRRISRM
ncbi:MAG: rhomboid family intramembrane serine protease [Phycisphaerae bacterium]